MQHVLLPLVPKLDAHKINLCRMFLGERNGNCGVCNARSQSKRALYLSDAGERFLCSCV